MFPSVRCKAASCLPNHCTFSKDVCCLISFTHLRTEKVAIWACLKQYEWFMCQTRCCTFCTWRMENHISARSLGDNLRVTEVYFPHFSAIRQSVVVAWEPVPPLIATHDRVPRPPLPVYTCLPRGTQHKLLKLRKGGNYKSRRNWSGNCPRRVLSLVV